MFRFHQLYDRITSSVISPHRAPPCDSILRCRDLIEAMEIIPGHRMIRERNELLQLLSDSHVQVSATPLKSCRVLALFSFGIYAKNAALARIWRIF